jgi:kumamolisin
LKSTKWVRSRRVGAFLAAGSASSLLVLGLAGTASASPHHTKIAVSQGPNEAQLQHLSVFGSTPASTPETVSFVLQPRNLAGLERSVDAGMPGGYLSVRQFAAEYGQTQHNIAALERYLSGFGISSTSYADGLNVNTTGTAGDYDSALSVQQDNYKIPAQAPSSKNGWVGHKAETIHAAHSDPLLPRNLGSFVLAVMGLDNYPTYGSQTAHEQSLATGQKPSAVQTGSLTPADFAKQYNLSPLYARGATGAGTTIGIVTLASLNPSDPEYFWNNVLGISTKADRITIDNVDGGPGAVTDKSGSGETTLDVEQSGALAPQASIDVYQAPNGDPGFTDAFYTAASQNVADSVSTSWGESETVVQAIINSGEEDPNYVQSFSDAFLELAAQGQSSFVASGDSGAYAASADLGSTNLSASVPDDSPYTTSAGGTTLGGTIPLTSTISATIPAERAWGYDWLWPYYYLFENPSTGQPFTSEEQFVETEGIGGGGGGFSVDEPTPLYQDLVPSAHHFSAVEYLTPTDYVSAYGLNLPTAWNFNPTPSVTSGFGTGRVTPDVVADADPFTGYLLYFSEFSSGGALQAGWGGTSFVAPQFNGATALMDSLIGHRVGFWNTSIYRFATGWNSPFTPLDTSGTSNDNLYYTGTQGQLFNVGTGLGTPNFARLAADFAWSEGNGFAHKRG